jgi:DNA repair protein RadC
MTRRYRLRTFTVPAAHEGQPAAGKVSDPNAAVAILRAIFAELDQDRENFVLLALDAQNNARGFKVCSTGTQTATLADAKGIFRDALALGAASIVISHNHPSGDPTPSRADITLTKQLADAGRLLELPVHDHIILGFGDRFVSFAQTGQGGL